ncbi:MAG: FAD-dependent oxidoreductase [Armatimonadota bacterium]|nr:FAD-dependent oxidoreductase [Armatimonadota bacterium]
MSTILEAEVVVIGAGAVGNSIAYHLAKRGKAVVIVDRRAPAAEASGANFGLVWVHSKEPWYYMELSLISARLYPPLVAELDIDVELRQDGGLVLCMTDEEYEKGEAMIARQRQSPLFRGRMLSAREVHELQPGITPEIVGASWSPDDGDLNPIAYTLALARACERWGVRILPGTTVTDIERTDGRVTAVMTDRGRIATPIVVNAAGVQAPKIGEMVGHPLPVEPSRGQELITESAPPLLRYPMSGIRQMKTTGQFILGFTDEWVGFDKRTTMAGMTKIAANAVRKVPAVRHLRVIRSWAGLRPMPKDGLPLIGQLREVPGFYVAVGHSGITLSPMYGRALSELICDGTTALPIEPYHPCRFDPEGRIPERRTTEAAAAREEKR